MSVITRFAPSPTGYLHIGGARTALFNYLFAKKNNGKFLLRIEDTDQARSTKEATQAIFDSLEWLNLAYDDEVVFQSQRQQKHKEAVLKLIEEGKAYYCFTSQEEIEQARDEALSKKQHFIFQSKWRDADPRSHPKDIKPVVRIKSPKIGTTIIKDKLQGDVVIENSHIDDMVLLRGDSTPTYMLAVVVDDHDMGITHIIRGDDHLTNAARQIVIYEAFGWKIPEMVHIPLIHGSDGAKLSKRHGALGVEAYRDMGYLPDALCNYLLRLGWSHGDDELISRKQAIEWFNLENLGKAAARIDFDKMKYINSYYIKNMDDAILAKMTLKILSKEYDSISEISKTSIIKAVASLKNRVSTLVELSDLAKIYLIEFEPQYSQESLEIIKKCDGTLIKQIISLLENITDFNKEFLQEEFKNLAIANNVKLSDIMQPLRILITGSISSPSIVEIMSIIGKDNIIKRVEFVKKDLN